MNRVICFIAAAIIIGTTTACKEEKKRDDIIITKVERKAPTGPISMQEYTQVTDVEWNGETVVCEINRKPDTALPTVTNENGQKFVDNKINLKIKYQDGNTLFEKVFTKNDFSAALDDDYRKNGVLEGLVFDKKENGQLKFAASVSLPQTDEYIPIVLLVSKNGAVNISRDTQMDTNGDIEEEV